MTHVTEQAFNSIFIKNENNKAEGKEARNQIGKKKAELKHL